MRFVTINLDTDDASIIRETLVGALERCDCDALVTDDRCDSCRALGTVASDLDRMLQQEVPVTSEAGRTALTWSGRPAASILGARSRATSAAGRLRLLPRQSDASGSRLP